MSDNNYMMSTDCMNNFRKNCGKCKKIKKKLKLSVQNADEVVK